MKTTSSAKAAFLIAMLVATTTSASGAVKDGSATDLFAFEAGTWIVKAPADSSMTQMEASPLNLIDGSASTDWTGEAGQAVFVFELAELTELNRISFDTAGLNRDQKAPSAFTFEVSEAGAESGFSEVLTGNLKMAKNGQSFSFKPEELPKARWVRLTILKNHGDDYQGFTGFHGYGKQLTQDAALPDLTGRYEGASGWGRINMTDTDSGVTGCYEYQQGAFKGQVDGRVLKLDMLQRADDTHRHGMFQMAPGGGKLIGLVRTDGSAYRDGYADYYSADKESSKPGSC